VPGTRTGSFLQSQCLLYLDSYDDLTVSFSSEASNQECDRPTERFTFKRDCEHSAVSYPGLSHRVGLHLGIEYSGTACDARIESFVYCLSVSATSIEASLSNSSCPRIRIAHVLGLVKAYKYLSGVNVRSGFIVASIQTAGSALSGVPCRRLPCFLVRRQHDVRCRQRMCLDPGDPFCTAPPRLVRTYTTTAARTAASLSSTSGSTQLSCTSRSIYMDVWLIRKLYPGRASCSFQWQEEQ